LKKDNCRRSMSG